VATDFEVARLYFEEHLKPKEISKMLRLDVGKVYRLVEGFKRNAKNIEGMLLK
jgi:DNA-binding transcriptional regulator LsrR (DeoR family)